jgi:hypothetical protein
MNMRVTRLLRSHLLGTCSFALFPFWHFDAKGGEVVLLGISVGFVGVGHKHVSLLFALSWELVSIYLVVEPICFVWFENSILVYVCVRHMDFGILYGWDYIIMYYVWYDLYLISWSYYYYVSYFVQVVVIVISCFLQMFLISIVRGSFEPRCCAFVFKCKLLICTHLGGVFSIF